MCPRANHRKIVIAVDTVKDCHTLAFHPHSLIWADQPMCRVSICSLFTLSVRYLLLMATKNFYLKMVRIFYLKDEDLLRISIICEAWVFGMNHPALRVISEEISDVSRF